jgi:hypothetical protein
MENKNKHTKEVISFTVEKKLLKRWKKYAKKNSINSSQLVEKFLDRELKKRMKKEVKK